MLTWFFNFVRTEKYMTLTHVEIYLEPFLDWFSMSTRHPKPWAVKGITAIERLHDWLIHEGLWLRVRVEAGMQPNIRVIKVR